MTGCDLALAAASFRSGATTSVRVPARIWCRIIIRVENFRSDRPGWACVKNGRFRRRSSLPATGARSVFLASVRTHLATSRELTVGVSGTAVSAGAASAVWITAESPSDVWK